MDKIEKVKISFIFFMITVVFIVIVSRLFFLSVIKYRPFDENDLVDFSDNSKRVNIVDRNNIILATDIKTKTLYLNKKLVENEEYIAESLSNILDLDYDFIYKKITNINTKVNYILIKRHIMPEEESKIHQLPIASIVLEDDLLRFYPHNNLFSHVVGYTDTDNNGIIGAEEYYDEYLKNTDHKPLKLTLDAKIQEALREELLSAYKYYKPNFVVGIVMEIKTGNILAMVSLPDFNPNLLSDRKNTFNHATYGDYELGSVFKIFTFANALEEKVIDLKTKFNVGEDFNYNNFTIKDSNSIKKKGKISTEEAFSQSSNVATIQIAQKIGISKQAKFFENLGLLEKINLDLNQTVFPLQPRRWREINLMTISYGYGLAVSPLHIINASNAILNDGNLITPRLSYNFEFQKRSKVISKETSDLMKHLFRITVEKGTGRLAHIENYNIGGKTGTARKITKNTYQEDEHISSFLGAFPINNPQYSIFIVVDRPKSKEIGRSAITGASIAEIVKNVILKTILFTKIKPIND